jgi:hypothetical protein
VVIKNWTVEPGQYAIHASHVLNQAEAEKWYKEPDKLPLSAIVCVVEVKKCIPRLEARKSQFDYHHQSVPQARLQAIVVRTVTKLRKPYKVNRPIPIPKGQTVWDCELPHDWQHISSASAEE